MARAPKFSGIHFGAAYYPEYQQGDTVGNDLELMKKAGFTVIRVGESVWSTWEPQDGEFNLDWLQATMDTAHECGIKVILGTPTYAVPPWLQRMHPEIAVKTAAGETLGWGARQEMDQSHAAYRWYAERVVRAVVQRYVDHPSVVGFQVDNEPGLHLVHNEPTFLRFVGWLRSRYGTVENLNNAWGLTYWSHRLADFSELWEPRGNSLPQYDLEWRRFQASLATDLISWQAGIVREYAREDQFVTTCISYSRPQVHDRDMSRNLDVVAGNTYYRMQHGLDRSISATATERWWSVGVPALHQWADRAWASAQAPFLVTETNAQSVGSSWQNHPPYPGQLKQAAFALIGRGARMIEYWHWHTLHHGPETYWGGVLPHSQVPGRIYREVAEIGESLSAIGDFLDGYVPDAEVLMLHSQDTEWSYASFPPLALPDGEPDLQSYATIFDSFYRGLFEAGVQTRIRHADELLVTSPADLVRSHPVVVVPTLYVADEALIAGLVRYAEAGGHLLVGIRTGYGDELARPISGAAPGLIGHAAGISYDEYTNVSTPWPVVSSKPDDPWIEADSAGMGWVDVLRLEGAEAIASFSANELNATAAVTTRRVGSGRITYVGTVPNPALARSIAKFLVPRTAHSAWSASQDVSVSTGRSTIANFTFLSNWSSLGSAVIAPEACTDVHTNARFVAGDVIELGPRGARILRNSTVG